MRVLVCASAVSLASALASGHAAAQENELPGLLGRLEHQADGMEQLKKRASYTFRGKFDELDCDGKVSHEREWAAKVTATGADPLYEITRVIDDGVDKTAEAKKKAETERKKRHTGAKRDFHLPFLASEQPRYVFAIADREPHRVRVSFVPKVPAEDAYKGSAWVDTDAGEVLTMGFSLSKNPTFVDHVEVTVRFDNPTALGRAPSNISFDGHGGFLFIKKHYRGSASLEDPRLTQ